MAETGPGPQRLVDGVWWLPNSASTTYLVRTSDGIVVVDPGLPGDHARVLQALGELSIDPSEVTVVALTHFHADHSGAVAALVEATGARVAAGAADAAVLHGERTPPEPDLDDSEREMYRRIAEDNPDTMTPPRLTVDLPLAEGDGIGGSDVVALATPGHTDGSTSFHLPARRALLVGDLVVRDPSGAVAAGPFNASRPVTAESRRRLAALEPEAVGTGHGAPVASGAAAVLRDLIDASDG